MSAERDFSRIRRLPPYVFNITAELKMAARRRGEDIIDMSMGNPDGRRRSTSSTSSSRRRKRPDTHGYSVSKGIPRLRKAISRLVPASATRSTSTPTPRRSSPSARRRASRT
jgi:alanine-synthesizing transaminase